MGKTIMTLVIPASKVRKPQPKAAQKHKDKTKYTRKVKHKAPDWGPCHMRASFFPTCPAIGAMQRPPCQSNRRGHALTHPPEHFQV